MPVIEASMVVTCKARLHHLRWTLPAMLRQQCPFDYEVIVVDYGCPDGTYRWCCTVSDPRLRSVRVVDDIEPFNVSRARNCGGMLAAGRVLAFVDADVELAETWLAVAAAPVLGGQAGLCTAKMQRRRRGWDRYGTCVVRADVFQAARGYDEAFRGWGLEDVDFYQRCRRIAGRREFPPFLLRPIEHTDEERVRHHEEKKIKVGLEKNIRYLQARNQAGEQVNPHGFGRGNFEICRCTPITQTLEQSATAAPKPLSVKSVSSVANV